MLLLPCLGSQSYNIGLLGPCVLVEANEKEALEISLVENLQRKDLDIWEESETFRRMSEELEYTQEEITRKIGKSIGYVSGRMGISALPEETKEKFSKFENVPQNLILQAVRADKAGKLDEYTEMVGNGQIENVKEAKKAVDRMTKKRANRETQWTGFRYGEYRKNKDKKGNFVITIRSRDEDFTRALVEFIEECHPDRNSGEYLRSSRQEKSV